MRAKEEERMFTIVRFIHIYKPVPSFVCSSLVGFYKSIV